MDYLDFRREKKLWKQGYKRIAGLDESGRGPLAGSVIAAAVTFPRSSISFLRFLKVNDSKILSVKQRKEVFKALTQASDITWATGKVSEKVIDKINILEATKLAMERAVEHLNKKLKKKIDFLILDGGVKINTSFPQKSIKKGDSKIFSIALASVIAKVTRDKMMKRYHKKYPQYGFDKHKGYATKIHRKMLKKYGPCKIHRKTFKWVK